MSRKTLVAITFALAIAFALPTYPAVAAQRCLGKRATIVGTNRNPSQSVELDGTDGDDVIVGLSGADIINAGRGDDVICAGGGDDTIEAGGGNDRVRAAGGLDDISGGGGNDRIRAGEAPAENLFGDRGNDRLFGGLGTEDYLFGGPGNDLLVGGEGDDIAMYPDAPRGIEVDLAAGTATGFGDDRLRSVETVIGSTHDDVLYGDRRANTLAGGPGSDDMHARGGDDRLRSGWGGNDVLDGGTGRNSANYYLSWFPVVADLATGEATTSAGETLMGTDTLGSITDLVGSKYADTLTGDAQDNSIHGSQDDDKLDGAEGADVAIFPDSFELTIDLAAGTAVEDRGSDSLTDLENIVGSAFADTIVGDDGPNALWGGRGDDDLQGAAGDDTLLGQRHSDTVDGGADTDTCEGETRLECELEPTAEITPSAPAIWGEDEGLDALLRELWEDAI